MTFPTSQLIPFAATDSSLWSMIQQGGWAMYPLALCSLALIYLCIHCYRETRRTRFVPETDVSTLRETIQSQAQRSAQPASGSVIARSLHAGLSKLGSSRSDALEQAETEIAATIEAEDQSVSQWIHYIAVVANVAPMVGLLGTVSGMIGGFQTMASGGMGRPELFAGDIGEALITTATGLCIGIPAMIAHSYFQNRLTTAVAETERAANSILEALPRD